MSNISVKSIDYNDYSKKPHKRASRTESPHSGVIDFGDLCRFAPYEGGYCFIAVFDQPRIGINEDLQNLFVDAIERDFRGLSGLNDKTGEIHDYGPSNAPVGMISKVEGMGSTTVTLTMTESTGTPITKYVGTYLDRIRDPYSQARSYAGRLGIGKDEIDPYDAGLKREVFNMLYIITDSTCFLVEKAFFLLNAQPINASYSDLYNVTKGDISAREISVNFNCSVREGSAANYFASRYMEQLINHATSKPGISGLVNLNSYEYPYSISGLNGKIDRIDKLRLNSDKKLSFDKGIVIKSVTNEKEYINYNPYKSKDKK